MPAPPSINRLAPPAIAPGRREAELVSDAAFQVAAIIPTYERPELTLRAVRSVVEQTLPPSEIVVVDDGSSPRAATALEESLRAFPEVSLINQPQRGVSAARNRGVAVTRAPWLAFLDSDDEWRPEKLELQIAALAAHPDFHLCHCDETWIRNGNQVLPRDKHRKAGGWIFSRCVELCCISPSSTLLRRRLFEDLGGFDEELPACEDYDLWLRVCSRHPVLFVERELVIKRGGHADQLSRRYTAMDVLRLRALHKVLVDPEVGESEHEIARRELERKLTIVTSGARKRGRFELADELEQTYGRPAERAVSANVAFDLAATLSRGPLP